MDDSVRELLSRYLDGDLPPLEAAELESRLHRDEAAREELVRLERVRAAVRQVAAREEPPVALDRIMEPLIVSGPRERAAQPWLRWLATAAAVVLGLTVIVEVSRRSPDRPRSGWQTQAAARSATETAEPFPLAPLPSAPGDSDAPGRGAVDRLLASEEPEIETRDEIPPALEVVGPLEQPAPGTRRMRDGDEAGVAAAAGEEPSTDVSQSAGGRLEAAPRAAEKRQPAFPPRPDVQRLAGQILVFVNADTAWRSFEPDAACEPGRYAVRLSIKGGVVRKVWPVWKPLAAPSQSLLASEQVRGLAIEGVADGEYSAEIVIESRPPPTP